jgi:hypothetical protein|eukprot:COSAG02_NODE_2065_length_9961_cov_37.811397_8_plen_192_part_00
MAHRHCYGSRSLRRVHNFGTSDSGGGPQSDETIRLGQNASFFYNLWEIALIGDEERSKPHHYVPNCTEIDTTGQCGNGNCTLDASIARGYRCTCSTGYTGDSCEERTPLDCAAQGSRATCENVTGHDDNGFQLYAFSLPPIALPLLCVPVAGGSMLTCLRVSQTGLQMGVCKLQLYQAWGGEGTNTRQADN